MCNFNNIHEEVNRAKKNLPYTFVNIKPHEDLNLDESAKFNETVKENKDKLYSGYLNCSFYVLNNLLVGNEHFDPEEEEAKRNNTYDRNFKSRYQQIEIKPLEVNKKILIAPYTLKGCVENFLASFLGAKMKRVNEQKFLFRPNINFKQTRTVKLGIGMVLFVHDSYITFSHLGQLGQHLPLIFDTKKDTDKYSYFDGNTFCRNNYKKKVAFNRGKHNFSYNGIEKELVCLKYLNGLDNHATFAKLFSNNPHRYKQHDAIYLESSAVKFKGNQKTINQKCLNDFYKTYEILSNDHLKDHPLLHDMKEKELSKLKNNIQSLSKLQMGDLIFYEYQDSNEEMEVLTFGKTYYFPWAYGKGLLQKDFPDDIRRESDLTILEEMFGYSFEDTETETKGSKSGKVHFNFATYIEGGQKRKQNFILPRPGSPKPTSYEFYLKQNPSKREPGTLNCFNEPLRHNKQIRLSGRKFYRASSIMPESINLNEIENDKDKKNLIQLNSLVCKKNSSYPKFKFRVNFNNLTHKELQYLIFALSLDYSENFKEEKQGMLCHQIGYGKNFGMGAIKICVENSSKILYGNNLINQNTAELKNFINTDFVDKLRNNREMFEAFSLHSKTFDYPSSYSIDGRRRFQTTDRRGNPKEQTTPNWHTNVRKIDLENRRR